MYSVKEIFFTLQGEGFHTGRPAVFCRFSGCNLWTGREEDRATAVCKFCDTDFFGIGADGGKFETADALAQRVADEWNGAFVDVVASLRENECRTLGGGDECAAERTREDARKLFVLCQNPVAEGDDAACGAPGTVARIGDVRYSLLAWVPEPHM